MAKYLNYTNIADGDPTLIDPKPMAYRYYESPGENWNNEAMAIYLQVIVNPGVTNILGDFLSFDSVNDLFVLGDGTNTQTIAGSSGTLHEIGVVINAEAGEMDLYAEGVWAGTVPYTGTLQDFSVPVKVFDGATADCWFSCLQVGKEGTMSELRKYVEAAAL